jgi:hypothetical protein
MKYSKKYSVGSTVNVTPAFIQDFQTRITTLLNRRNGVWNGTMSQLNQAITTGIRRAAPASWPTTPSVLRRVVNTVLPRLRNAGISVRFGRANDRVRTRYVSFRQN